MASTRGEEKERKKKAVGDAEAGRRTSSQQKRVEVPQREVERLVRELEHAVLARHPIHQVLAHRRAIVVRTRRERERGKNKVRSVLCFRCRDAVRARRAGGKSLQREIFACRCGADTGGGDGGGGRAGARDGDLRGDRDRPLGKSMRERASRGGARVGSRRTRRRRGRGRAERARRARKRRPLETVCAPEQVPVLDVGGEGVSPLVGAPSAARGERVDVLRGANLVGGG